MISRFLPHPVRRLLGVKAAGRPPAIIISHFALALAGLGIWIGFMAGVQQSV